MINIGIYLRRISELRYKDRYRDQRKLKTIMIYTVAKHEDLKADSTVRSYLYRTNLNRSTIKIQILPGSSASFLPSFAWIWISNGIECYIAQNTLCMRHYHPSRVISVSADYWWLSLDIGCSSSSNGTPGENSEDDLSTGLLAQIWGCLVWQSYDKSVIECQEKGDSH